MRRIQIQLSDEQTRKLKRHAAAEEVSVAEIVRRAVDQVSTASPVDLRQSCVARARRAAGMFASGKRDVSSRHDRHLVDAFGS